LADLPRFHHAGSPFVHSWTAYDPPMHAVRALGSAADLTGDDTKTRRLALGYELPIFQENVRVHTSPPQPAWSGQLTCSGISASRIVPMCPQPLLAQR
jgi:hypothetical protein